MPDGLPDFEEYIARLRDERGPELHPTSSPPTFACERPEASIIGTSVDVRCRACVIALGASAAAGVDTPGAGLRVEPHTPAEVYEWARHYHGLPPLPARRCTMHREDECSDVLPCAECEVAS